MSMFTQLVTAEGLPLESRQDVTEGLLAITGSKAVDEKQEELARSEKTGEYLFSPLLSEAVRGVLVDQTTLRTPVTRRYLNEALVAFSEQTNHPDDPDWLGVEDTENPDPDFYDAREAVESMRMMEEAGVLDVPTVRPAVEKAFGEFDVQRYFEELEGLHDRDRSVAWGGEYEAVSMDAAMSEPEIAEQVRLLASTGQVHKTPEAENPGPEAVQESPATKPVAPAPRETQRPQQPVQQKDDDLEMEM